MEIIKCTGEGQGSCKRCSDNGKWNRIWTSSLYKVEGLEGCYCDSCVKEIIKTKEINMEKYGLFIKGESGRYDEPSFVGTQKEISEFAEANNLEPDYYVCHMDYLYLLDLRNN